MPKLLRFSVRICATNCHVVIIAPDDVRGHWGIENSLHWTLDVIFAEDRSRIRMGNGPEIASIFRKLALMVLQRDTSSRGSLRGKRLQAGWNEDFLERILCGFCED